MLPPLEEVKRRRLALGLTQAELAEKADVSQSLVAKIENGKTDPVYSKLKSIFDTLEKLELSETKTARDVMSTQVYSVTPSSKMKEVFGLMKSHNISQVPVLQRGRCVGSVTERTILSSFSEGKKAEEMLDKPVSDFMGPPFPLLESDASTQAVSNLLSVYSAVLVTEGGRIMGIITRADLF